ncbi:hypothetical protein, partial [Pseudomonas sp. TMW22089]|uniref:hypothetical protein n=1 Tax=Pseudomonas sp. TMW22089 TaxID=2506433 RepID=UPI001F0CF1BF
LLTFACVLGISERHLLHRGSTVQFVGQAYFTRFGSPFQSFLKHGNLTATPPFCNEVSGGDHE